MPSADELIWEFALWLLERSAHGKWFAAALIVIAISELELRFRMRHLRRVLHMRHGEIFVLKKKRPPPSYERK
jgi:hypothetical protein